jgi:hypothetical protein
VSSRHCAWTQGLFLGSLPESRMYRMIYLKLKVSFSRTAHLFVELFSSLRMPLYISSVLLFPSKQPRMTTVHATLFKCSSWHNVVK